MARLFDHARHRIHGIAMATLPVYRAIETSPSGRFVPAGAAAESEGGVEPPSELRPVAEAPLRSGPGSTKMRWPARRLARRYVALVRRHSGGSTALARAAEAAVGTDQGGVDPAADANADGANARTRERRRGRL